MIAVDIRAVFLLNFDTCAHAMARLLMIKGQMLRKIIAMQKYQALS